RPHALALGERGAWTGRDRRTGCHHAGASWLPGHSGPAWESLIASVLGSQGIDTSCIQHVCYSIRERIIMQTVDRIVEVLEEAGIYHVVGIPGGTLDASIRRSMTSRTKSKLSWRVMSKPRPAWPKCTVA